MTPDRRLEDLFHFDTWANLKLLALLEEEQVLNRHQKIRSLFNHILGAQDLWYRRVIGGNLEEIEVWPGYPVKQLRSILGANHEHWMELLEESEDSLARVISYENSSGISYDTRLSDIMHHVIIHGQHHRAQIASLLRENKIVPPATDYIFYIRETDR